MKLRGLGFVTALVFMLSTLPIYAEGTNSISNEGEIPITQYIEIDEAATVSDSVITLPDGAEVSYSVTPERAGWYKLIAKGKGLQDKIPVTASLGEESYTGYFNKTNRENAMGRFYLSEGENIITIQPETEITYTKLYLKNIEHSVGSETNKIAMVDYKSTTTPEHDYVNNQWNYAYDGVTGCLVTASATTSYLLDVAETGIYKITMHSKSNEGANIELLINGETVSKTATLKDTEIKPTEFPPFVLEAGACELVIADKGPTDVRFNYYFTIEKVAGIMDVEGLFIGEQQVAEGETVPRSTDVFRFKLTAPADETSFAPEISENGRTLKSYSYCDGKNGYLVLEESLEADTEYRLTTGTLADSYGFFTSDGAEFTVNVAEMGGNNASMENITTEINGADVTVKGTMKSSMNAGISGRGVKLYIKDANGVITPEAVAVAMSGAGGAFELNYTITSEDSGVYTAIVEGEYVSGNTQKTLTYISSGLETDILGALADIDTWDAMQTLISTNATKLGINLASELPSREITDKSKVYDGMVRDKAKITSVEDLIKVFRAHAVMQTVLQTSRVNRIYTTLTDETKAGYVSVDNKKVLAVTDATYSDNMLIELKTKFDENEMTSVEDFAKICNKVADKWLAKQYGKENLQINMEEVSVYIGKEFEIPINLSAYADNLSKLIINISASDGMFDNVQFQAENGSFEKSEENGIIILTYISSDLQKRVSKIGSIKGVAGATGVYTAEMTGIAEFDEGIGVSIITDVLKSDMKLTVRKNSQKGQVSQGSSGGGGGGSSKPSKPTVSVPVINNDKTENPMMKPEKNEEPAEEKFEFKDLDTVEWSKESIEKLLERKIISESEDRNFNPDREMTRAEFAKMIVTALGIKSEKNGTNLKDISENQWFYEYVVAAEEHGLIQGDEKGNFNAESSITRQDMAVIMMRVFEKLDYAATEAKELFKDDADIAEYAKNAVYTMKEIGVLNGVGEGKFAPIGYVTRAMGAKVVFEMLKVVGI